MTNQFIRSATYAILALLVYPSVSLAETFDEGLRNGFIESMSTSCFKTQRANTLNAAASDRTLHKYCDCMGQVLWNKLTQEDITLLIKSMNKPSPGFPVQLQPKVNESAAECLGKIVKK